MGFSKDFLWGAAASSAQIEGGWMDGGRTPSIWDVAPSEKINNGENSLSSCDHYHRMREDVALMKEIGLKSYRFSVSWSRIMPKKGEINPDGVKFYSDLIDELIANGIEPLLTVYHWDLPVWVEEEGGWLKESIVPLFAEYTKVLVDAYSDRVKWWMTINEPNLFIKCGYVLGSFAPFKCYSEQYNELTKNCILAHYEATKTIRKYSKQKVNVGVALSTAAYIPLDDKTETIDKARQLTLNEGEGLAANRWWMDPICAGKTVACGDYQSLDFVGLNIYQPFGYVQNGEEADSSTVATPKNSMGWIVDERCLYWNVKFIYEEYGVPIMITENGYAADDKVAEDDKVYDVNREEFMKEFIANLKRATEEYIPILGYQHWSVMDNFEWTAGYDPRFGLIHIDYNTQKRTIKNSAYYYKHIIETNGDDL